MIGSFYVTLFLTVVAVAAAWLAPGYRTRMAILCAASALLIGIASPLALLAVGLNVGVYVSLGLLRQAGVSIGVLKILSWGFFIPLVAPALLPAEALAVALLGPAYTIDPSVGRLTYLGLSYTAIRFFMAFREGIAEGNAQPWALAGTALFFGSFPAGPIVGTRPYRASTMAARLARDEIMIAMARIGWGAAKLFVLARVIGNVSLSEVEPLADAGAILAWVDMFQAFFVLYLDFSGYTDVAIGLALLFGIRLPENFRSPLLATSMQDFWQRWHLSLGIFISTYLFKPLVRHTGRPAPAIFAAFLFVGLWHQVTWTYLLWGIGHGGALALNMVFARRFASNGFRRSAIWRIGCWSATMTWVAALSMIATAPSPVAAWEKTLALIGVA
jgi:D-alanyl-lipoteichoic acid acyltransferase DltB (MBOAT superfamily)